MPDQETSPPERPLLIAVYQGADAADRGVRRLIAHGLSPEQLSLLTREPTVEAKPVSPEPVVERRKKLPSASSSFAHLRSLLSPSVHAIVPGIGKVLAAGPASMLLARALEGTLRGEAQTALGAALHDLTGDPQSAQEYDQALKERKVIVAVHGEGHDFTLALDLLLDAPPLSFRQFGASEKD